MWFLLLTACLGGECKVFPLIESRQEPVLHLFKSQQECIDESYERVDKMKEAVEDISVFPTCLPLSAPA